MLFRGKLQSANCSSTAGRRRRPRLRLLWQTGKKTTIVPTKYTEKKKWHCWFFFARWKSSDFPKYNTVLRKIGQLPLFRQIRRCLADILIRTRPTLHFPTYTNYILIKYPVGSRHPTKKTPKITSASSPCFFRTNKKTSFLFRPNQPTSLFLQPIMHPSRSVGHSLLSRWVLGGEIVARDKRLFVAIVCQRRPPPPPPLSHVALSNQGFFWALNHFPHRKSPEEKNAVWIFVRMRSTRFFVGNDIIARGESLSATCSAKTVVGAALQPQG